MEPIKYTVVVGLLVEEYNVRCPEMSGRDAELIVDAAELFRLPFQLIIFPPLHILFI